MNAKEIFMTVAEHCSKTVTQQYSTSFASAIKLLHPHLHAPIYAIYGFVRVADEIVDTFHEHDKKSLLARFRRDTELALEERISLNPVLHGFQKTVHQYQIDRSLIDAFFRSMEMDLEKQGYADSAELQDYIFGSAEAVGLMCLYVFCEGNHDMYQALKPSAQALGSAFQKVNFLRDMGADYHQLSRVYFPGIDIGNFDAETKVAIEKDILADFDAAYAGIRQLPPKARFGVYVAYRYYLSLFDKIRRMAPSSVTTKRVRIANLYKMLLICRAGIRHQLKMI